VKSGQADFCYAWEIISTGNPQVFILKKEAGANPIEFSQNLSTLNKFIVNQSFDKPAYKNIQNGIFSSKEL